MQIDTQTLADHVAMFLPAGQLQALINAMGATAITMRDDGVNADALVAALVHMQKAKVNNG